MRDDTRGIRERARDFWLAQPSEKLPLNTFDFAAAFAEAELAAEREQNAQIADRIRMNGITTPREAAECIAAAIRARQEGS